MSVFIKIFFPSTLRYAIILIMRT